MNPVKKLRYRLEYAAVQSAAKLLQALPLGVAQAAGRGAGRAAWALGVARAAANENLAERLGLRGAEIETLVAGGVIGRSPQSVNGVSGVGVRNSLAFADTADV